MNQESEAVVAVVLADWGEDLTRTRAFSLL